MWGPQGLCMHAASCFKSAATSAVNREPDVTPAPPLRPPLLTPAAPARPSLQTFLLESAYAALVANCRPTTALYRVPRQGLLAVGVDYQI